MTLRNTKVTVHTLVLQVGCSCGTSRVGAFPWVPYVGENLGYSTVFARAGTPLSATHAAKPAEFGYERARPMARPGRVERKPASALGPCVDGGAFHRRGPGCSAHPHMLARGPARSYRHGSRPRPVPFRRAHSRDRSRRAHSGNRIPPLCDSAIPPSDSPVGCNAECPG